MEWSTTARVSSPNLGARTFPDKGFRGAEIPKCLPYSIWTFNDRARPARSRLWLTYPDAPSAGALTGLSYAAICPACARQYQGLQISPRPPAASRPPQQPTCRDQVVQLLAPPGADLHHFSIDRVCPGYPGSRFRVALTSTEIGSKGEITPPSAHRHRASPITGTRRQRYLSPRLATWETPWFD